MLGARALLRLPVLEPRGQGEQTAGWAVHRGEGWIGASTDGLQT